MTAKLSDHRGDSFVPTRVQQRLYQAGWRLTQRKKVGCVWIVRWTDPKSNDVWNQGTALQILRRRELAGTDVARTKESGNV